MLTVHELQELPLPAQITDEAGTVMATTPEWPSQPLTAIPYRYGDWTVTVAPSQAASDALDESAGLMMIERVLSTLREAASTLDETQRRRLEILAEGLAITTGRIATTNGTTDDVIAYLNAALPVRTDVRLRVLRGGDYPIGAPAAAACALIQVIANAGNHMKASEVDLFISGVHGTVSFRVQWPGRAPIQPPKTSRTQRGASRTGLKAARIFTDAIGASMTGLLPGVDPATQQEDTETTRTQIDVGADDLMLPLAQVVDGVIKWCTRTWWEETQSNTGDALPAAIAPLEPMALEQTGQIVVRDSFSARATAKGVWIAQRPDDVGDRSRLAASLIDHERALLGAPDPIPQKVQALVQILLWIFGEDLPYTTGDKWNADIALACSAYGITAEIPAVDVERILHPIVAAYLMAEYGTEVVSIGDDVHLVVDPTRRDDELLKLLADGSTTLVLTK